MPADPERRASTYEAALDLVRVLAGDIVSDEALAGEIAAIAYLAEREGRFGEAEATRAIARNHRIRALEAQGYLAALRATYGQALDGEA